MSPGRSRKLLEEIDIGKITKTLTDEGIKNFPINTTKGTQHYFPSKSGKENIFMRAEDGNYVLDVYAANKPDFRELRSGNEYEILHNCRRAYNDKLNSYDDTLDDKYMSRFAEIKKLIQKEASRRIIEGISPTKTLLGFIRSGYCELKEPEILEFQKFLADEKDIYEEDYKRFRPLTEWQEYLEDFKNSNRSLNESRDKTYIVEIGDKLYLQGNSQDGWDTTADPEEAAVFESKTEPTQIINQMKRDGKLPKNISFSLIDL